MLTWKEFITMPINGNYKKDKKFEITHGDEIVTFVKSLDNLVGVLRIKEGVNYSGCSKYYVIEKIELTIKALEWIKRRVSGKDEN